MRVWSTGRGERELLIGAAAALVVACSPPPSPPPEPEPAPPPAPEPSPSPETALCPPVGVVPAMATEADTFATLSAQAETEGSVRVIVELAAPDSAPPGLAERQQAAVTLFEQAGVEQVDMVSERLPLIVAEVSHEQLTSMYHHEAFGAWSEDRIAYATLAESGPLVQAPQLFELGGRGAGQAVAILDTGVDAAHPFLAGRVVAEACFSTNSTANGSRTVCPNGQASQTGTGAAAACDADGCDHGTHVAGISSGSGAFFEGIAPEGAIIAVQVFSEFRGAVCRGGPSPCVASFTSDQIRGLDFVLQQAGMREVKAANMSLGGGRSTGFCDNELMKPVIDQLRDAGVATVIASGNDGFRNAVSFPACISSAVTVGATSKEDALADFSNCGPQTDLHAPGVSIRSSVPGDGFARFNGTSMAAPHVAGAFAAIASARPEATLNEIELALKDTGLDVEGRPRIRLFDAAQALGASAPAEATSMETREMTVSLESVADDLAALPQDEPVRIIVEARLPTGAAPDVVEQAMSEMEALALEAGAERVERLGSQPLMALEVTPAEARALMQSGAVASMQIDRIARPQEE